MKIHKLNRVIGLYDEATDQIPLNPPLGKGEMASLPAKFGITRLIYEFYELQASDGCDLKFCCQKDWLVGAKEDE